MSHIREPVSANGITLYPDRCEIDPMWDRLLDNFYDGDDEEHEYTPSTEKITYDLQES